jgi:hypothetical protein
VAHSAASFAETNGMLPITPEDAGFAPNLETLLDRAFAEKRVWHAKPVCCPHELASRGSTGGGKTEQTIWRYA